MNPFSPNKEGILTLKSTDENLQNLGYFFRYVVEGDEMEISDVTEQLDDNGIVSLSGRTPLWGGSTENPNSVSLQYDHTTQALNSFRVIRSNHAFDGLSVGSLSFQNLQDHLFVEIEGEENPNNGLLSHEITGTLKVSKNVSFGLKMLLRENIYDLEANFEGLDGPSLSNLINIIGGDGTDLNKWLPESLSNASLVSAKRLTARIDPESDHKLVNTSLWLEFLGGQSWHIIPGFDFLSVGQLWAFLDVDEPLDSAYRFLTVEVGGTIQLGSGVENGRVRLKARWPDLAISGELEKGDTIELASLLEKMGLPMAGGDEALRISRLSFDAEPLMEQKSFSFGITVENAWTLELGGKDIFELKEISFNLSYQERLNEKKKVNGSLFGKMAIAEYEVFASASNSLDGWEFSAWSSQEMKLASWIGDLAGNDWHLPDGLADFGLKDMFFSFHTATKELSIRAASAGSIKIPLGSHELEIKDLGFSFKKNDKSLLAEFKGSTSIEMAGGKEFGFNVLVEYLSGDSAGWLIDAQSTGELPIGDLMKWLVDKFGFAMVLPEPIQSLELSDVYFNADLKKNTFRFGGKGKFELAGQEGELLIGVEIDNGAKTANFKGDLVLTDRDTKETHAFTLTFGKGADAKYMAAKYNGDLTLQKVVRLFDSEIAKDIPSWLSPSMKETVFLISKEGTESHLLLGLKMDFTGVGKALDLSKLEFAGKFISEEESKLGLTLTLYLSTKELKGKSLTDVKAALQKLGSQLPLPAPVLNKGLTITTNITAPLLGENLTIPVVGTNNAPKGEGTPTSKTDWRPVKKRLGPVFIEKAGFTMEDGKVKILLDAGMEVGGFVFKLVGFGIKIPMKANLDVLRDVDFGLEGLELQVKKGELQISGMFASVKIDYQGVQKTGYFGEAQLRVKDKSFKAIGSFINLEEPSFFLFAVVSIPIGGPSFFFVNGFAAGFGINSRLNIPTIEKVREFIFLKAAFNETRFDNANPSSNLALIANDVPPQMHSYWGAVGLKVSHMQVLNSFFLATVSFGTKVEVNLLGLTRLDLPPPGNSIAKIEMAMHARFLPDEGTLMIEGRLSPGSYILNPLATLSGGFAFYSWFKDNSTKNISAGDFVLSVGGYHPRFIKPAHYPDVPRLALNWQLSSFLSIKGEMYFALTPQMLMAGGRLEARADLGPVQAWFTAEAHFLINFSPFHYSALISVSMGISLEVKILFVKVRITISFSAQLELWGPEFGGFAKIDLSVVEIELSFGAPKTPLPPLTWLEFQDKFLPSPNDTVVITVGNGMVKDLDGDPNRGDLDWIMNPSELSINIESAIPIKTFEYNSTSEEHQWGLGIAPMNLPTEKFATKLMLQIWRDGKDVSNQFKVGSKAFGNVPRAFWGKNEGGNKLNGSDSLIANILQGVKIVPKPAREIDATGAMDIGALLTDAINQENTMEFGLKAKEVPTDKEVFEQKLFSAPTKQYQKALAGLGFDDLEETSFESYSDKDLLLMESDPMMVITGAPRFIQPEKK